MDDERADWLEQAVRPKRTLSRETKRMRVER